MNVLPNRHAAPIALMLAALVCAMPAQAADEFCDFEDGTLCGWLPATTGGSGSTTVQLHNGSKMAYVQHTGSLSHSLSHDFAYNAAGTISFDMHAVANLGVFSTQATSGVTLSFLNSFNVSLGTVGLYNTTNPAALGVHQFSVDNLQHSYSDTMASFATLAGIGTSSSIAKVGISFIAAAETNTGQVSAAAVWFDNVRVAVAAVPEPSSWALMLAGAIATGLNVRRRRQSEPADSR